MRFIHYWYASSECRLGPGGLLTKGIRYIFRLQNLMHPAVSGWRSSYSNQPAEALAAAEDKLKR